MLHAAGCMLLVAGCRLQIAGCMSYVAARSIARHGAINGRPGWVAMLCAMRWHATKMLRLSWCLRLSSVGAMVPRLPLVSFGIDMRKCADMCVDMCVGMCTDVY